ncbi:3-keto-5-aminohexanoate cleavage protein [Tistrella mobilis]|uniref:3-keto-5-aminohexanoate cleavage protein n=1 Tax=Tistrella mobilis TaxID=171437 RepID=UPI003557BE42
MMNTSSRRPVWIEAALNGPWGRDRQPGIPVTEAEIIADGIAAARAGAGIIHVHAYDPETGRQNDDGATYARIIEGIRATTDALVYPTIPLAGAALTGQAAGPAARFAHIDFLASRGLIEMAVVDPGTVCFIDRRDGPAALASFVYTNTEAEIRHGLALAATHRLVPSYAIYEPGFTRAGALLAGQTPGLATPLYRFMFSDAFAWGFPPRRYGLEAHLALLGEAAPAAPWMIAGLGVDLEDLVPHAVAAGGHVRTGLEDAPFGTETGNAGLVARMVQVVEAAGGRPATPAEIRTGLGLGG